MGAHDYPALVLNADFRPLSYFPLSLWGWQEAVKAVFLRRVHVLSEYERKVRSPSREMALPSVIVLKQYIPVARRPAFTTPRVPGRTARCARRASPVAHRPAALRRRSGGRAVKVDVLTWGDLASCLKGRRRIGVPPDGARSLQRP